MAFHFDCHLSKDEGFSSLSRTSVLPGSFLQGACNLIQLEVVLTEMLTQDAGQTMSCHLLQTPHYSFLSSSQLHSHSTGKAYLVFGCTASGCMQIVISKKIKLILKVIELLNSSKLIDITSTHTLNPVLLRCL